MSMLAIIAAALTRAQHDPAPTDPEEVCLFCEGRGWVRWTDVLAPRYQCCLICGGVSVAGVYLVESVFAVAGREVRHQLNYQSQSLAASIQKADRLAAWLTRSSLDMRRVRVLYQPLDTRAPVSIYSAPVRRADRPL